MKSTVKKKFERSRSKDRDDPPKENTSDNNKSRINYSTIFRQTSNLRQIKDNDNKVEKKIFNNFPSNIRQIKDNTVYKSNNNLITQKIYETNRLITTNINTNSNNNMKNNIVQKKGNFNTNNNNINANNITQNISKVIPKNNNVLNQNNQRFTLENNRSQVIFGKCTNNNNEFNNNNNIGNANNINYNNSMINIAKMDTNEKSIIVEHILKLKIEKTLFSLGCSVKQESLPSIISLINDRLKKYLINIIKKLIQINRMRNINFDFLQTGKKVNPNDVLININFINNMDYINNINNINSINTVNKEDNISDINTFDILTKCFSNNNIIDNKFRLVFTSNFRNTKELLNEYLELYWKKIKFKKLSLCKQKYEEQAKQKGSEASIKIENNNIKLPPGRKPRKKDSQFVKMCRKDLARNKKKDDLTLQNQMMTKTLNTFLNAGTQKHQKSQKKDNQNQAKKDQDFTGINVQRPRKNLELRLKIFDSFGIKKKENNNNPNDSNRINNMSDMNVDDYNHDDPLNMRNFVRFIDCKDLVFYLENTDDFIPNKYDLLNEINTVMIKRMSKS